MITRRFKSVRSVWQVRMWAAVVLLCGSSTCVTMAHDSTSTVAHASHNHYMEVLRRHVASLYVTQLQTQNLWTIQGKDTRSLFWREERKRQEALGGLGPAPTKDEVMELMTGLPDGVVYDFMNTYHMADACIAEYIQKQDRLIGLVDTVSSEIKIIDSCERTGKSGMKDYEFLLTIDDGPSRDNQDWLLKELELEKVKAIFFLIGDVMEKERLSADPYLHMGHDLGMHTSEIDFEYDPTCRLIDPLMERKWFRAHGGSRTTLYTGKVRDVGGLHLLWNIDSRDWEFVGFPGATGLTGAVDERVDRVVASSVTVSLLRGAGIVLFHETVQLAPDTIGRYVRMMKALGCEFITPEAAWEGFAPEQPTLRPEPPEDL